MDENKKLALDWLSDPKNRDSLYGRTVIQRLLVKVTKLETSVEDLKAENVRLQKVVDVQRKRNKNYQESYDAVAVRCVEINEEAATKCDEVLLGGSAMSLRQAASLIRKEFNLGE